MKHHARRVKGLTLWLVILAAVLFTVGCSGAGTVGSWPGLQTDGDRVYVAYGNQVIAIDGADGEQIWQYNGQAASEQFYAPPLVTEDEVIIGDFGVSGGIFAGGRLIVKMHAIENGSSNPPQTAWIADEQLTGRVFASGTKSVDGRHIYVGTGDNKFVALDSADGSLIWEFLTNNSVWSSPVVVDDTVYFTSLDKKVYAVNGDSGDLVWAADLTGAIAGSAVYNAEADLLYVGSFSGQLVALDRQSGEIVWEAPLAEDWVWGSPTFHNGIVYFSDLSGKVYAVDGEDGHAIWDEPLLVPGSVESAVLVDDEQIIVASGDISTGTGTVTAFTLNGEQQWQEVVEGAIQSRPVMMDGDPVVTFVPAEAPLQVVRLDRSSGETVWRFTPPVTE